MFMQVQKVKIEKSLGHKLAVLYKDLHYKS